MKASVNARKHAAPRPPFSSFVIPNEVRDLLFAVAALSLNQERKMKMSIAQSLLAEFEVQAPITRRFLERLPEDKLTWKPHEKSMTAGQLAYHLAFVPGGVIRAVQNDSFPAPDFASFPQASTRADVLKAFDESIATVRDLLPKLTD